MCLNNNIFSYFFLTLFSEVFSESLYLSVEQYKITSKLSKLAFYIDTYTLKIDYTKIYKNYNDSD